MSDKTLVERLRELQNRDCACITQCDFVNAVGAKCCREMQGYGCNLCFNVTIKAIIDAIEREYLPRPRFEDGEPVQFGDMAEVREDLGDVFEMVYQDGKCVEVVIGFGDEETASHYTICEGERVKRPELEVLDADGVPINVGDTVFRRIDGREAVVKELVPNGETIIAVVSFSIDDRLRIEAIEGYAGELLTHKPPVLDADGVPINVGDTVYVSKEHWTAEIGDGAIVESIKGGIVYTSDDGAWSGDYLTHKKPDSLERIEEDAEKNVCVYFAKQGNPKCDDCDKALGPYLECHREMMLDLLNRQREVLERDHER